MSDTSRHAPSNEVLNDRIKALRAEVDTLKTKVEASDTKQIEILVAIKVLQTKVGLLAAGIGIATGTASSVMIAVLQRFMA